MILPFELGRSSAGRPVTQATEIDDSSGVSQQEVNELVKGGFINVTRQYNLGVSDLVDVLDAIASDPKEGITTPGVIITFLTDEGWKTKQYQGGDLDDPESWKDIDTSEILERVISENNSHHAARFDYVVEGEINFEDEKLVNVPTMSYVVWCKNYGVFALRTGTSQSNYKYYQEWEGEEPYHEGGLPHLDKLYICGKHLYMYDIDNNKLIEVGSNGTSGIFNVTTQVPIQGFYVLCDTQNTTISAVHAAWRAEKAVSGLIISFEISAGIWKTYQYIGRTLTEQNWLNPENWKDFGSLAAGSETHIIIDDLIGAPIAGEYYTLETAVARLVAYQRESGVNYAKKGLVISYKVGENTMETKQFQGEISDFGEVGLWKDFGGGTDVEVTDEPEEDSEKVLSAGGAYAHIPTGIKLNTETEGIVKMQLENAEHEAIGEEVQFAVGTGGGGGGGAGTIVTAAFQQSPFYGNAGGEFILRAAVRSVTTVGQSEQENTIATIGLYDRDTNTLLEMFNFNKASSATMTTYDFVMDVSKYFVDAGVRRFRIVITDDAGNTGQRNINITAVDVTVTSVQTLQYTSSTSVAVGGGVKSIPLYKFANNSSDRGITAITEIYLNGEWRQLGTALITDVYSHGITIDPNNCLGVTLSHGAYPVRVHGVDVASGVVGNYLYTGIFVIDETSSVPLVVESWMCPTVNATLKLYETIQISYAVYDPSNNAPTATVYLDGEPVQSHTAYRSMSYSYSHQVTGVESDGSFSHIVKVKCGSSYGTEASFNISGTVIDAALKSGAIYGFEFSNRSNEEADHSISNNGFEISVEGSNWSTTGFTTFLGEKCLRIAEDVTASLDHQPFKPTSLEANGMAIQFAFASKNLVDDDAILMKCFNEGVGAGFYVTGKAVGIYCSTGLSNHKEERAYRQGEKVSVAVVVEPAVAGLGQTRQGTTYYFIKLYLNGEEVAVIGYVAGQSNLTQEENITFDGTYGDFYLYYLMAWEDYFQFDQAFQNYLVKLTDTEDMVQEYNFESVMASQAVTELGILTTKLRPQASELASRGMAYVIECPFNGANIEGLDETVSTKDQIYVNLFYVDPARPWTDFVARDVARRNQGTTSAQRPVKNPRYYLAQKKGSSYDKSTKTGGTTIQLTHTREEIVAMGYDGALWDKAAALAAINKIQLHEDSIPVDIITIKVDYSDSSNANDCGICDMMNATFRALGSDYMTPAQRAFDGTWKKGSVELDGLVMNHSTANIPIALFRSKSDTGSNPYFHSKGNWKEDKKEQVALGFNDVPGYNKGCLNYGDFIEFYGEPNETLAQTKTRFLGTSGLDTSSIYVLTQYCGSSYKVMKHNGSQWVEQTGSMVQNANGKWTVSGYVVNPIDGFELLNYQGMDWFKGVSSVADLMAPSTSFSKWVQGFIDSGDISVETVPAWTYYFESLLDDDNLSIAYALGKKVPYNLFRWMQFCDTCDYDQYGSTALSRWKAGLWRFASPHSCLAYDVFTDYLAAVDQRAKNMQPMWFLEDGCKVVNGVYYNKANQENDNTSGMLALRMYLNKVYDCDSSNGYDNDGGHTIDAEVDPNKMPDAQTGYTNPYAGYNSTLFRNIYLQQAVNIDAGGTELSLRTVASAMRSRSVTVDGMTLVPFSPEGAMHFFVNSRIKRWQKKVSSYDGERKYIDFTSTTANNIYFYALQGLGLTSLPAFIERRWRIRDGFFGTGNFFSGVLSGRVNSANDAEIHITAAKTGYFGIGNDSSGSISESVYLEAGESHSFTNFSHEEGALLYIYQADRMSKIDLSEITLSSNFDFSVMTLAEEIILGCEGKTTLTLGAYTPLTNISLGELPFLKKLDITDTIITNVVCSSCPRLESLYAAGSQLERVDLADGAKVTYLELPSTYKYLKLRYLQNLTLEGLVLTNPASISYLICEECAKIDAMELLRDLAGTSGTTLRNVRIRTVKASGTGDDLTAIIGMNLGGYDAVGNVTNKPALVGRYNLTRYYEESEVAAFNAAFDGLVVKNIQYTGIVFDDTESVPQNIKNLDNNTGYGTGQAYAPSAHILNIWNKMHAVRAKFNDSTHKMEVRQLSDETYLEYADGSEFNPADPTGEGFDVMLRLGHFWYKGVNDYKTQKKYTFFSSVPGTPEASGEYIRKTLSQLTKFESLGVNINGVSAGNTFNENSLATVANLNSYVIDVTGMKQVRFPGVNQSGYGAVFVDENDQVVGTPFNLANGSALFDFYDGSGVVTPDSVETDYLFVNVPTGAVKFYFCCFSSALQSTEVIATDSTEIEAIEPDWVEHLDNDLIGVYGISIDGMNRVRSVSGVAPKRGTNTQTTWTGWTYDENGKVTNTVHPSGINYTCKDFMNLAEMRGEGYQLIDYEHNKIMAQLFWAMTGHRNDQAVIGNGSTGYNTTGVTNAIGKSNTNANGVNKLLGLEGFIACWSEWMDNIAFNVDSWAGFKKAKCLGTSQDKVNYHFTVYDPVTDTERKIRSVSGNYNIARLKHGRRCDTTPIKLDTSDNSKFITYYCASANLVGSTGRVVLRASFSAYVNGGLACTYTHHASSGSYTGVGSRLAFRGDIVEVDE